MTCEDFPCCGHEPGCCPDFDEAGNQLNMVCVCGAKLPIDNPSSCCDACLRDPDDPCEEQWWEEGEQDGWDDECDDDDDVPNAGPASAHDYTSDAIDGR